MRNPFCSIEIENLEPQLLIETTDFIDQVEITDEAWDSFKAKKNLSNTIDLQSNSFAPNSFDESERELSPEDLSQDQLVELYYHISK